jgi:hypothetical protein
VFDQRFEESGVTGKQLLSSHTFENRECVEHPQTAVVSVQLSVVRKRKAPPKQNRLEWGTLLFLVLLPSANG